MTDKKPVTENAASESPSADAGEVFEPEDTLEQPEPAGGQGFFSPEDINRLLRIGRTTSNSDTTLTEDAISGRIDKLEALLEKLVSEGGDRNRRMEESNRAMRAYFTDEIGRLRDSIIGELRLRAAQQLLQEMVPVLNDLDDLLARSEEALQNETTARLWRALQAFRRRLFNGMRRLGLEELEVLENQTVFDPYLHECVNSIDELPPGDDAPPPGTVVRVKRKGYLFQSQLFQAPQVIIQGGEKNDVS